MSEARTKDLTNGSPMKLILTFMLPLILGLLFQQLYSMVDTIVVGKFLGMDALAGVGSTGSVSFLVLGLCSGVCAGFAIPVAQKFGQRDFTGLRHIVGNMLWLGGAVALAVTLVTTILCRQILIWMDTPADAFSFAYDYIFVIFLGIPAMMLYNLLSGILRSLGDSRTPLMFLIASSLLNVLLDLVFILVLEMGVAGAGWATLASQLISGLLCLYYMERKFPILHLRPGDLRPRRDCALRLLTMGLPMGLQYSITAVGSILLQTAVNSLGSCAMAAMTAGSKVGFLWVVPFDAMGTTAATFAGQNLGAGKPERIHEGVLDCSILGSAYALLSLVLLFFCGGWMTKLFLEADDIVTMTEVVRLGRQYLLTNAMFYIPLLFVNVLRFTIQGLGFSDLAVAAGVFEMIARGVFGLCLVPLFGFTAVCFASPAAWIMADLFLFPAYFWCMKKRGFKFRRAPIGSAAAIRS